MEQNIYSDDSDLDKQILGIEDENSDETEQDNRMTQAEKILNEGKVEQEILTPEEAKKR